MDSKIRISIGDLPGNCLGLLVEALEIPNQEKEKARDLGQYGWQRLPDKIELWEIDDARDEFIAPMGFQPCIFDGLAAFGEVPHWIDKRAWHPHGQLLGEQIDLRPWQVPQVESILSNQFGIVKAPAGSGKTVSVLAAIQRLKCNAIVIVNTKDIMWQWQERIEDFLGPESIQGQIGDGEFDVSPHVTVATAQTLYSRFGDLRKSGFFDSFSFVCLDECHHATAETYNRIVSEFSSVYRIGVSATPDKTGQFALATHVLGPIIHETNPADVSALTRPKVMKVLTGFEFGFKGSGRRSNYQSMISALTKDKDRNEGIVQNIINNAGHHQLVISKRLGHLKTIQEGLEAAGFEDPIVTIIGENDSEHRKEAKALAETSPCVVLSTLADEALDIPRLDRLHLIYPQRNTGLITQQVGRVERVHDEKGEAIIYDYADMKCGPFESQFRQRRWEVYEPRGYTLETMTLKSLLEA